MGVGTPVGLGSPIGSGLRGWLYRVWGPQWGLGLAIYGQGSAMGSGVRNGVWGPQWGLGSTMGSAVPNSIWGPGFSI